MTVVTKPALRVKHHLAVLGGSVLLGTILALGLPQLTGLKGYQLFGERVSAFSALPMGAPLQGHVRYGGTAQAPSLTFVTKEGDAFAHVCHAESWSDGCATIQLQAAFAQSIKTPVVADVYLEVRRVGRDLRVVLMRSEEISPFLILDLKT